MEAVISVKPPDGSGTTVRGALDAGFVVARSLGLFCSHAVNGVCCIDNRTMGGSP